MNGTEAVYILCVLIAAAGLSKLKRILKRYGSTACTDRSEK